MYIRIVKNLLLLILFMLTLPVFSQTWYQIPRLSPYTGEMNYAIPSSLFEFNPFTNDLWFVSESVVSILENDGDTKVIHNNEELGNIFGGINNQFCFTSNHVYYANTFGTLYTFDNYTLVPIISSFFSGLDYMMSSSDTVYFTCNSGLIKYTELGGLVNTDYYSNYFSVKDTTLYTHSASNTDQIGYYHGATWLDYTWLHTDPDYLGGGVIHEAKFARHTDTLYVAGPNGISFAEAYEFIGNYSPSNTVNMPSSNVIEIDFDANNDLWAVFGDANDKAFTIARLDGNTWVDLIDETNSPVNFQHYKGHAIDPLGNHYICDSYNLTTWITPNSPGWLSTTELSSPEKELIGTFDLLGRPAEPKPNTLLIYQYSDGTTEKKMIFE